MKLNKIFAVALAVLTLSSCDNDTAEDYPAMLGGVNTASDVTVSLPPTFKANEDESLFYVPVELTGTANGKVQVTVQVKELPNVPEGTEPAVNGKHFNITSYTINIPEGETEGGIEVLPIWEIGKLNDDRVFQVEIVNIVGATVGNASCMVTIANIDNHFTALLGAWTLRGVNPSSGEELTYKLTFKSHDDPKDSYGKVIYAFGMFGEADYLLPFHSFTFDEATMTGTIEIGYGWMMTDGLAFNYGLEAPAFPVAMYREGTNITLDHSEVCTFDANYDEIKIPASANVFGGLFYTTTMAFNGYGVGWIGDMTLTRN